MSSMDQFNNAPQSQKQGGGGIGLIVGGTFLAFYALYFSKANNQEYDCCAILID